NLHLTEHIVSGVREDRLRSKREPEPIRCQACGMIRIGGRACKCGHVNQRKSRMVIQVDGTLKEHTGDIFKPRLVKSLPNTVKLWTGYYYQAKNSRNRMTFNQAIGLFFIEQHYFPPRDLPLMPRNDFDWYLPVADVPRNRLT